MSTISSACVERASGWDLRCSLCRRERPSGFLPYPSDCPEIHRHLRLMEFIGVPSVGDHLEFPPGAQDHAEFKALPEAASLQPGSFVCLHPGGRGSRVAGRLRTLPRSRRD